MATRRAGLTLPNVYFESEVVKLQEEAYEKGFHAGIWRGAGAIIVAFHKKMDYSAEIIVEITGFSLEFVQSTIEKLMKKS